jgi:transposase-like protein
MFKMRCQVCGGTHTKKNGVRKGVQLYKCKDCGHQFRSGIDVSADDLWIAYQQGKQTISELSACYGMSVSTVKRRLQGVKREWVQPQLSGEGFVHLDVTYWGRGFGVLLALDTQTCMPLYMAFVKSETVKDYEAAVNWIRERG